MIPEPTPLEAAEIALRNAARRERDFGRRISFRLAANALAPVGEHRDREVARIAQTVREYFLGNHA